MDESTSQRLPGATCAAFRSAFPHIKVPSYTPIWILYLGALSVSLLLSTTLFLPGYMWVYIIAEQHTSPVPDGFITTHPACVDAFYLFSIRSRGCVCVLSRRVPTTRQNASRLRVLYGNAMRDVGPNIVSIISYG